MDHAKKLPGDPSLEASWLSNPTHRAWLRSDALNQLSLFRGSLRADGGFNILGLDGMPLPAAPQELHTTSRMIHSFALGHKIGAPDCTAIIDAGLDFLWTRHHDTQHGGYGWSVMGSKFADPTKLAYGNVFVLLAASSAHAVGHPDAYKILQDVATVIEDKFWDAGAGLLRDEFTQGWQPFSTYRGYNANMHGAEAFLAAYEATGDTHFLKKAGSILSFFVDQIASTHQWRLPEHYTEDWTPDLTYRGNPMFRPYGTTPGHSFELGRLLLQHWDLTNRPKNAAPQNARKLIETAFNDAWLPEGGFAYTLDFAGKVDVSNCYWWPLTEAIGAMSALIKVDNTPQDEARYRQLWQTASHLFIDHAQGGWYPEIDKKGQPVSRQFKGKPDIYHALQADVLPLANGVSRVFETLRPQDSD